MVSHIHYNLNAHEDFVISFTSKFITSFIDSIENGHKKGTYYDEIRQCAQNADTTLGSMVNKVRRTFVIT